MGTGKEGWKGQRGGMGAERVSPNSGNNAKMKKQDPETQGGSG